MKRKVSLWIVAAILSTGISTLLAVDVSPGERKQAQQWVKEKFAETSGTQRPFSFDYADKTSAAWFQEWVCRRHEKKLDPQRKQITLEYQDPLTGLVVRCVAISYLDFPSVEWTMYFKNTGAKDTPLIKNIQALDLRIERLETSSSAERTFYDTTKDASEFILHHHTGSNHARNDFEPHHTIMGPNFSRTITPFGGRPTNEQFSYFNVEMPGKQTIITEGETDIWKKTRTEREPGTGVIVVIGWPGQWAADFTRNETNQLRIRAGQETTCFTLHPGEEVRTPLIVLQFWQGDRQRSQNIWRRWMLEYSLPRPGGTLPPPLLTPCSSHQFNEMLNANEENQKHFIDRYLEEKLNPDYWWMDAGWYFNNGTWVNTGTWEIDTRRFPHGFRPISDHAHAQGVKIIVWFEPERVTENSWLWDTHPEWLLSPGKVPDKVGWMTQWKLLDLGNPQARQWLTDHVDKLITEQGIDLYRQDFNMDPLFFWRNHDTPDRQGMTENYYVSGYLAYWDELRRRHPNMLIDSCASGGRRNDLETMRRAVPFIRSDYIFEEIGQQCHTYAINWWIPYHGTGTFQVEPYHFWSTMAPHVTPCWDMRNRDLDYDLLRTLTGQWREVSKYYNGDYYTLTPYSLDDGAWMAWQFHEPDLDEGVVMAFRRPNSYTVTAEFVLQDMEPESRYVMTNIDKSQTQVFTGAILANQGLPVTIKDSPGVAVILYKKVR